MFKKTLAAAFIASIIAGQAYAGGKPVAIVEPTEQIELEAGKAPSAADLHERIVKVLKRNPIRGLNVTIDQNEATSITATFNKNSKNFFTVAISHDDKSYKVSYVSSVNMDYSEKNGVRMIHRHYPGWIQQLTQSINQGAVSVN